MCARLHTVTQADVVPPAESDPKEKAAADGMLPDALCLVPAGPDVGIAELSAKPPPAGCAPQRFTHAATRYWQLIVADSMSNSLGSLKAPDIQQACKAVDVVISIQSRQ